VERKTVYMKVLEEIRSKDGKVLITISDGCVSDGLDGIDVREKDPEGYWRYICGGYDVHGERWISVRVKP
jgi:hypothetical protein